MDLYENIKATLSQVATAYDNAANSGLRHQSELVFALDMVKKSLKSGNYGAKAFQNDPQSLVSAFVQSASLGLTLNPAHKMAYIFPRDGKWVLEVSYQGLVKLAHRAGGISNMGAEIVRENDHFRSRGTMQLPEHQYDPFATEEQRGEVRGVYAFAELNSGHTKVVFLNMETIGKIRASNMGSGSGYSPWKQWPNEMMLKSGIKRLMNGGLVSALSDATQLQSAIHYMNETVEGIRQQAQIAPPLPTLEEATRTIESNPESKQLADNVVNRCLAIKAKTPGIELMEDRFGPAGKVYIESRLQEAFAHGLTHDGGQYADS